MLGPRSVIVAAAVAGCRVKSGSRRPCTHPVAVSRAYSGYMEYVGAKESAVRPGPPNACMTCSMTSLDPFAAHTWSAVSATPDSLSRYAARSSRRARKSRSGYRFRPRAAAATSAAMSATTSSAGGYGFSLTLRSTGTSSWGAP
jgi:hypothetical protein